MTVDQRLTLFTPTRNSKAATRFLGKAFGRFKDWEKSRILNTDVTLHEKLTQLGGSFAFNFDPPFYLSLLLLEGSFKKGALPKKIKNWETVAKIRRLHLADRLLL